MTSTVETLTLGTGAAACRCGPGGAERSLVVIPDIWGLRPLFESMCRDLHERTGWTVASFEPFPDPSIAGLGDPQGFAARSQALAELDDRYVLDSACELADVCDARSSAITGFCMGAMYAYKSVATGRFERTAAFYGMIHLPDEWKGPGQGEPLDAIAAGDPASVLAIVGTEDGYTPPDALAALRAAGVQVVEYAGAEHGFVHDASRPTHRADDAADAWRRVIEFLGR